MGFNDELTRLWGGVLKIGKTGLYKTKDALEKKGMEIGTKALTNIVESDQGQKIGAAFIKEGITKTVEEASENAKPLVKMGKDYLNPENKTAYEVIRQGLNPPEGESDGFIKSIFKSLIARVIDVGTGIAGWIGATFINKVLNPKNKVPSHDIHNIFASFMGKVAGFWKKAPAPA